MAQVSNKQKLINEAREAVSGCQWKIGECAHKWKQQEHGTDQEFADAIDVSLDQVKKSRIVYEAYHVDTDLSKLTELPNLKWSHFYFARTHPHREELLRWASDNKAPRRGMQVYANAQWPDYASGISDAGEEFSGFGSSEDAEEYAPFLKGVRGEAGEDKPLFTETAKGVVLSEHGLNMARRAAQNILSKAEKLVELGCPELAHEICDQIVAAIVTKQTAKRFGVDIATIDGMLKPKAKATAR